jgi:hypothetical protein
MAEVVPGGMAMRALFLLLCGLLLPLSGLAQTGVYATFNASNFDVSNVDWQYGPTIGVYHNFWHAPFLAAGFDARGSFIGSGSTKSYSGLLGPHVELRPHVFPAKLYAEALGGIGDVGFGQGVANSDTTAFAYQLVAGIDVTILPRIDWRLAEVSYSGFSDLDQSFHPRTIATGLVLRLP